MADYLGANSHSTRETWLLNSRPLRLNPSFFIVPSDRNRYLKSFLHRCPYKCENVKELLDHEYESGKWRHGYCLTGKIEEFDKIGREKYYINLLDIKDNSCPVLKVYFTNESIKHLPRIPDRLRKCSIYVSSSSGISQIGTEGIVCFHSSPDMICILVCEIFYRKHKKFQVPLNYVSCIPLGKKTVSYCDEIMTLPQPYLNNTGLIFGTPSTSCSPINANNSIVYVPLKQLKKGTTVNVIACVRHFKPSETTKTKKSVYRTFSIVDPSLPFGKDIVVVAFANTQNELPAFTRIGDIILLQHIQVNFFRTSMQITCNSHSGFMLFDTSKETNKPYCKSKKVAFFGNEIELVSSLKQWAISSGYLNSNGRVCQLNHISPGLHFDLECIVLSVQQKNECLLLTVYDEDVNESWNIVINNYNVNRFFKSGQAVYLYNVHANPVYFETTSNHVTVKLLMTTYTHRGICFSTLTSLDAHYNSQGILAIQSSSFITRPYSKYSQLPRCTLAEIVQCTKIPTLFRCAVYITSIGLPSIESCVRLKCSNCFKCRLTSQNAVSVVSELSTECPHCKMCNQSYYTYIIPLTVTDTTANVAVYLWHENAIELLQSLPPTNVYLDRVFKSNLLKSFECLMGRSPFDTIIKPNDYNSCPQLDCCICSYYGGPKMNTERKVYYHITNTELLTL